VTDRAAPQLSFHEPAPAYTRLVAVAGGLVSLYGAYALQGAPPIDWSSLNTLLLALLAALGLVLIAMGALGLTRTVTLNPETRRLLVVSRAAFGLHRSQSHDFATLNGIVVRRDDRPEGDPLYRVEAPRLGGLKPILITVLRNEAEAQRVGSALSAATGLARLGDPTAPTAGT
jgi:hypothetical protein